MPGTPTEIICPDCGKNLTVEDWGYKCECGYRQRHQPDPARTTCPIDGTELTNDVTKFDQPAEQNVMTWHRLHYHDYLYVKDRGKRFCSKCLWTEP